MTHRRIDTILKSLGHGLARQIDDDSILDACRQVGHRWRRSTLDPVAIIHWFPIQVLHGNTSLGDVARPGRRRFSGVAYGLTRSALPLAVFRAVLD